MHTLLVVLDIWRWFHHRILKHVRWLQPGRSQCCKGETKDPVGSTIAHTLTQGTPIVYVNFNYRLGPLGYPIGQEGMRRLNQPAL
jgi:hypothetical protein